MFANTWDIFFVFGTGKVDTIGVYIVMMGFAFLITNWKIKQLNSIIVLFSISLGVKYTNWPLIVLPLTFLIFYQLIKQFSFKSIIIAFIPFLFIGPVLIKNKININNPLAPLIYNANQSRYVKSHGSLPEPVLNKKVIKKLPGLDKFKISKKLKYGTLFFLGLSICWIIFRFFPKSALPEAWLWALYLILSLFPWFYSLGFSNQPLRFIWAPIMLTIIASNVLIETFTRNKTKFNTHLSKGLLAISIITLISVGYIKHGNRIQYFLNSQTMSLESWYSLVGKDHYSFSQKIKDLNILKEDVLYLKPLALGLFPINNYAKLPTDEMLFKFKKDPMKYLRVNQYIIGSKTDLRKNHVDTNNILLKEGKFYLIKR